MTQTAAKTQIEAAIQPVIDELPAQEVSLDEARERQAKLLRFALGLPARPVVIGYGGNDGYKVGQGRRRTAWSAW